MLVYYAGIAFTIAMAVTCVRRGQAQPWLWIILFLPTVGALVYLVSEVLGASSFGSRPSRKVSRRELRLAEAEVRRLDNAEAWTDYAHALRSRGEAARALAAAEKAVEKDAASLRARYELGLARLDAGESGAAIEPLASVVEQAPNHDSGEARFALALAYERHGDKESARLTLETLARTTSLPKVLYRLASLQAEAGDREKARESLERIIEEADYVPNYHRRQVRPWVRKARRALASLS